MKPYRSKRMGPRSGPGGFSSRGGRGGRQGTLAGPSARLALAAGVHFPRGQRHDRFPGRRARGEGSSRPGGRTYSPPVSGRSGDRGKPCPPPRGTRSGCIGRPTGEDCSQCSSAAASASVRATPLGCQGLWRSWPPIRPVLKHGPRSLTCAQVTGLVRTPKAK